MCILDSENIGEEAKFLYTIFSNLKPLTKEVEYVKYVLGLHLLQKQNFDNDEWEGATIRDIVETTGERFVQTKHRNLRERLFRALGENWFHAPTRHKLKMKKDAFNAIEELLTKKSGVFSFFQTPIPLEEFQGILTRLDSLYYVIKSVNLIDNHNQKLNKSNKKKSLYKISEQLNLSPYEFIKLTRQYSVITNHELTNYRKDTYLTVNPGIPKQKPFFLWCDDYLICNTLCRRCHNTYIDLTPIGRSLGQELRFKSIFISNEPSLRIATSFFTLMLQVTSLWYLISYFIDKDWFFTSIPYFMLLIVFFTITKWMFGFRFAPRDELEFFSRE